MANEEKGLDIPDEVKEAIRRDNSATQSTSNTETTTPAGPTTSNTDQVL